MQSATLAVDGKSSNVKSGIYFKSEVVVKGENYGWVMWTGLSTIPEKEQTTQQNKASVNFLHKIVVLEKEDAKWSVKHGYSWIDSVANQTKSNAQFVITAPLKQSWIRPGQWDFKTGVTAKDLERKWAGIAEVRNNSGGEEFITSITVKENEWGSEFWGSNGTFSDDNFGYKSADMKYDVSSKTWQNVRYPAQIDLSQYLVNVYKPLKGKQVVWNDLETWCNNWSSKRNRNVSSTRKQDFESLCYKKTSN